MAITWDAVAWLKANYNSNNGVPGFYIAGSYLPTQRTLAEEEYKKTIDQLAQSAESAQCQEWAKRTRESEYLTLKTMDSVEFWQSLAFTTNMTSELTAPLFTKFIMRTPTDYVEPSTSSISVPTTVRRRVEVEETDGIMLSGFSKSLMSHLKTLAANRVHNFDSLEERAKCRVIIAMNNVLDIDDITADGLYFCLEPEQQDEITNLFDCPYTYKSIHQDAGLDSLLNHAYHNWNNVVKKLYAQLSRTSDLELAATYKIALHLAEIHDENDNAFENKSSLSEADFIVKVWGAVIEKLFYKTKVFCRWGDTLSVTDDNDYTSHRLDLRLLCKSNLNKHDVCDGEFGKQATASKVYHDKGKLVANGKNQLNYILKNHTGEFSDAKIVLLQVLGFEADLYQLWLERDGVYVLQKIKRMSMPTSSRKFMQGMNELMDGLSVLRFSALELAEVCNDNGKKVGRLQAATGASPAASQSAPTRDVWKPPRVTT